jgi:hypothetical protein
MSKLLRSQEFPSRGCSRPQRCTLLDIVLSPAEGVRSRVFDMSMIDDLISTVPRVPWRSRPDFIDLTPRQLHTDDRCKQWRASRRLACGFWGMLSCGSLTMESKSGRLASWKRRRAVPGLAEPCEPVSVDHLPVSMKSMICPRFMCCRQRPTQNCRATARCCGEDEHPCKQVGLLRASGEARCRHAIEARSRAWMPCSRSTAVRDDSLAPTWAQGW